MAEFLDFITIYRLYGDEIDINWLKEQSDKNNLSKTLSRLLALSNKTENL